MRAADDLSPCLSLIVTLPPWPFIRASSATTTANAQWLCLAGARDKHLCMYSILRRRPEVLGAMTAPASCITASRTSSRVYVADYGCRVYLFNPDMQTVPPEVADALQGPVSVPPLWTAGGLE